MANVIVTPSNLAAVIKGEIANHLVGDLRDSLEENIIASIPAEIKDDPPIDVSVTYSLDKSNGSMKFDTKVSSQTVQGVKEAEVSASNKSSAHTRILDGQRNFKTESGFVTGNKVPDSVLKQIVDHGIKATRDPGAHAGHSFDADQ
jgi:hypothetical protein